MRCVVLRNLGEEKDAVNRGHLWGDFDERFVELVGVDEGVCCADLGGVVAAEGCLWLRWVGKRKEKWLFWFYDFFLCKNTQFSKEWYTMKTRHVRFHFLLLSSKTRAATIGS